MILSGSFTHPLHAAFQNLQKYRFHNRIGKEFSW
jgi:hypothetical protein